MVHIDVGPVTMGDLEMAAAAADPDAAGGGGGGGPAPILAFNVANNGGDVTAHAKKSNVQIRRHKVRPAFFFYCLQFFFNVALDDRALGHALCRAARGRGLGGVPHARRPQGAPYGSPPAQGVLAMAAGEGGAQNARRFM